MRFWPRFARATAAIWLAASLAGAAHAEPLRIGWHVWVGYGPLFVAQEQGLFAEEDVDVELVRIDDHTARLAALYAGQIDALTAGTQEVVAVSEPDEEPLACVLAFDDSRGGDGILATKDIRTIADLEGRSVAFIDRSISQFYLNVLLKEFGLSQTDVEVVDLPPDKAAEAFMLQEVDAAVVAEPYLSEGSNVEHGHLLTDTSEQPGLLTDCLAAKTSIFGERKKEFQAVARAWDAAVHFVGAHPDEANVIMARNMGDWLEDPVAFGETLRGIVLYDADQNREYFGTQAQPGQIYQTMRYAIDVWSDLGLLKVELEPVDVITHGIWEE